MVAVITMDWFSFTGPVIGSWEITGLQDSVVNVHEIGAIGLPTISTAPEVSWIVYSVSQTNAVSGEKVNRFPDQEKEPEITGEIKTIHDLGAEIGIVIGAGNIFRGKLGESLGIKRVVGDHMGMLATIMNSLALKNELDKLKVPATIMSAIDVNEIADSYIIRNADQLLCQGHVVISAGGTGHPFFTTDTAASLRAVELNCDVLLKATKVDGVYTSDPEIDETAEKIDSTSYIDVIKKQLRVMDLTAVSLCMGLWAVPPDLKAVGSNTCPPMLV